MQVHIFFEQSAIYLFFFFSLNLSYNIFSNAGKS